MPPTPKRYEQMQKYNQCQKNENRQKHIILEGFSQNGLQIRNQRIFLRIVAPVKIDFRHFSIFIFFERHDATDATTRRLF